jgi:hypothetical protein
MFLPQSQFQFPSRRYLLLALLAGLRMVAPAEAGFRVQVETYSTPDTLAVGYAVPAGDNVVFYTGWEYGDDVQLAAGAGGLADFHFDYRSNYALTDGWTFRLYELDLVSGLPGRQIFSQQGNLQSGETTATIHFSSAVASAWPVNFFYSVQFTGLGGGKVAGLVVPNRLPTTGTSAPGFLIYTPNGWIESAFASAGAGSGDLAITSPLVAPEAPTPLGQTVVLSVAAVGRGPLIFQWRRNGVVIPGETRPELNLGALRPEHAGYYEVAVTDGTGAVLSNPVRVEPALPQLPFANAFATAINGGAILAGLNGVGQGSSAEATTEAGEPAHGPLPAEASLWLTWRPDVAGVATFSTLGSDFDTVLAVYEQSPFAPKGFPGLVRVGANDEAGDPSHSSRLDFNVVPGRTYLIAVDGNASLRRGGRGQVVLNWKTEVTGDRLPSISQSPPGIEVRPGDPARMETNLQMPDGATAEIRWFRLWPSGLVAMGISGPVMDLPAVNEGTVGRYVAEALVTYPGGAVRTIRVGLFDVQLRLGDNERDEVIAWDPFALSRANAPPTGAAPAAARIQRSGLARGTSGTQIFSSIGSTREDGEPAACGVIGSATSWYALLAEADGAISVDTVGSSFDTVVAIYTDTGEGPGLFDGLRPVVCNDDAAATVKTSAVEFCGRAGTVYFVQVDGVGGAVGTVKLNFSMRNDPPGTTCELADSECLQGPAVRYVPAGGQVALAPEILNPPPYVIEWLRNGQVVEGARHPVLVVSAAAAGDYQLRLTSRFGQSDRPVASVRLISPGEIGTGFEFLCDGRLRLLPTGAPNQSLILERSTDLQTWTPVSTNAPANGLGQYLLPAPDPTGSAVFRTRPN